MLTFTVDTITGGLSKGFRCVLVFSWYPQSLTKYLEQSKEIKQNWTGPEKLDICFSVIFNLHYQIFTSENETGHMALLLPNFDFFLIFTNFISSEVLSCSATHVGIEYNVFILDIGTVLLVLLGTLILKIMAKNETFISETKNNQN